MNTIVFLILRRLRVPLIALICAYAVTVLGFTLVPGIDGQPLSIFHAFYFTSFMATTIGFGEIPSEFSDAQRLWATLSIYVSVVAWFYALGKIITLFQDAAFRQVVIEHQFSRSVAHIREPFYLVAGFGDTGGLLVRALTERNHRAVTLDIDPLPIHALALQDYLTYVPGLCADASVPEHLMEAGLGHPGCKALIALTNDEQANLSIAIAGKLLNPKVEVICRAESHDVAANMASFDTDHVIDPFDAFAGHLAMAIHSPGLWLLHEWLTGVPNTRLALPLYPPQGRWIVCGYGRFGKAVNAYLRRQGIETVIVEATPEKTGCHDCVVGRGTEHDTLAQAGIFAAVGVVAGTDDDANNLSIVMTAREMNPDLFVVMRQNRHANDPLFRAIDADLTMQASEIIVHEIIALLTAPLLARFLARARAQDNDWANELVSRISAVTDDNVPEIWEVEISGEESAAVYHAALMGTNIILDTLLRDPRARDRHLPCVPLMLARGQKITLVPGSRQAVRPGDHLLFCGRRGTASAMAWTLQNRNALSYVLTGEEKPDGTFWRWLRGR